MVAFSSPVSSVTNRTPGSWWTFLAVSGPILSVTNRFSGSFLSLVAFWPTLSKTALANSKPQTLNLEARISQDAGVRCDTNKSGEETATRTTHTSGPERHTKTRGYDLLQTRMGQKEPPRSGSTICYGEQWEGKSHQDQEHDLLRIRVGQKKPPKPGTRATKIQI